MSSGSERPGEPTPLARKPWMTLWGKSPRLLVQLCRSLLAGGMAGVADFGVLTLLVSGCHVHYLLANIASYAAGTVVNYLISTRWVFATRNVSNASLEFTIFATIGVVGLALSELLLWLGVEALGLHYLLAKVMTAGAHFAWAFSARKFFLFRDRVAAQ